MSSWHEFITMGGYAVYVWPAFGIGFLVLLGHVIEPIYRRRRLLRQLAIEHALNGSDNSRSREGDRDTKT